MNTYKAFYNGKEMEVEAFTSYGAQLVAVSLFRAKKKDAHMVHVKLLAKDGVPVVHKTSDL